MQLLRRPPLLVSAILGPLSVWGAILPAYRLLMTWVYAHTHTLLLAIKVVLSALLALSVIYAVPFVV